MDEYARREFTLIEKFARDVSGTATGEALSLPDIIEVLCLIATRAVAEPEIERLCLVLQAEALGDPEHPANAFFREREKMVMDGFELMLKPHYENALDVAREFFAMAEGLTLRWLQANQGFDLVAAWDRAVCKLLVQR